MLANLKCPNCFSTKVKLWEEGSEENALCIKYDCCRLEFNHELARNWDPFVLYAVTISGARKEKKPSLALSRSIFPKAHSTADLISPKSTGFIA